MHTKFSWLVLFFTVTGFHQATATTYQANSADNQVALLELYTSEGCSSCPPADELLSVIKKQGIDDKLLIPLAFHVTYWDYIGWKDRFADRRYDNRQRQQVAKSGSRSVYTPQFMLNGTSIRVPSLEGKIQQVTQQNAQVKLDLQAKFNRQQLTINVNASKLATSEKNSLQAHSVYLAVYQHGLSSNIKAGENHGRQLHHDYVVRELVGPFSMTQQTLSTDVVVDWQSDWQKDQMGIVAFVQPAGSHKVVQAVNLSFEQAP